MRHAFIVMAALALPAAIYQVSAQQTLADRVADAAQPRVQFTFAARADACGNGRTFFQVSGNQYYGNWSSDERREACVNGPVRVVFDRAGREVISIRTYVGPIDTARQGITDLGRIRASDAADYLLGLAERAEGRVSRDAVLPAMLADSVDLTPRLLAIVRNQNAARSTRSSAISWLGSPMDTRERAVTQIATTMLGVARDEDDNQNVRQQALRALARLEHGAGTALLMDLARDANRTWLAREALSALTNSGDPRARQHIRDVVRRADMADDPLAAAIRGLGGEYATGEDIRIIREAYDKLPGEKSRESAISSIAQFGGTENVRWMLALARDANKPASVRRRAVEHAYRAGSSITEIIKLYDETTDMQMKEAVMSALVQSGDKLATDKLIAIAKSDPSVQARRKAINYLSRSSDERVKQFLLDLSVNVRQ